MNSAPPQDNEGTHDPTVFYIQVCRNTLYSSPRRCEYIVPGVHKFASAATGWYPAPVHAPVRRGAEHTKVCCVCRPYSPSVEQSGRSTPRARRTTKTLSFGGGVRTIAVGARSRRTACTHAGFASFRPSALRPGAACLLSGPSASRCWLLAWAGDMRMASFRTASHARRLKVRVITMQQKCVPR